MDKGKKSVLKQILIAVAIVLVFSLLGTAAYVYAMLSVMKIESTATWELDVEEVTYTTDTPTPEPEVSYTPLPTIDESLLRTPSPAQESQTNESLGIINIAVFGMDNRYKYQIEGGRSDVNIILTIDTKTNEVRLSSVIRDTLIYVEPLNDYNRINAAIVYAQGPEGAVECIEQEFGIEIDHYMLTSFVGMARIIDAVGGVDVYVPSKIVRYTNYAIQEMNPLMGYVTKANFIRSSGNIHLNGIQAVAFMRQRKHEGGFARDDNQKEVLADVRSQIQDLSIQDVNNLLTVVSENVKTDMEPMELIEMTMYLYACKDNEYKSLRIPLDGTYKLAWYSGMSIVQYEKDNNIPQLYDFIYNGIDPLAEDEEDTADTDETENTN